MDINFNIIILEDLIIGYLFFNYGMWNYFLWIIYVEILRLYSMLNIKLCKILWYDIWIYFLIVFYKIGNKMNNIDVVYIMWVNFKKI